MTEEELKQFAAALSQSYDKRENFTAEIIEELFIIKCLTARLSGRALSWVSHYAFFSMQLQTTSVNNIIIYV